MKRLFLFSFLFLTACFHHDAPEKKSSPAETTKSLVEVKAEKTPTLKDHELLRFERYLEQADAIHREAWWVVAAERKVQGKSIFGKAQRALQNELGVKLGNKSLFRCDRYFVKRDILSPLGLPQKGEIYEKCSQNGATLIADYSLPDKTHGEIHFYPQHLDEVMGIQTSILNRKVYCVLGGDEEGKLDSLHCENMAQDRNGTQSIQFSVYDYQKTGKNLLSLKGQVYESLSPMRKIEAQVPMEGKIRVVETQVEAPEGYVRPGPSPVAKPSPTASAQRGHRPAPPPPADATMEPAPSAPNSSAVEFSDQPAAGGARTQPAAGDPDMMIYQQQQQQQMQMQQDPAAPGAPGASGTGAPEVAPGNIPATGEEVVPPGYETPPAAPGQDTMPPPSEPILISPQQQPSVR